MDNKTNELAKDTSPAMGVEYLVNECAQPLAELLVVAMRQRQQDLTWTRIKRAGIIVFVLAVVFAQMTTWSAMGLIGTPVVSKGVAVVSIRGEIAMGGASGADRVVPLIESACEADTTEAVLVRISSPGGSPSEAARIGAALASCGKPTTAMIEQLGASAAYLVAVHANRIAADPYAMVGSIGAIMKRPSASDLAKRWGVKEQVYASGDLKAGGSYLTDATPEQAEVAQSLVEAAGRQFEQTVRARRPGLAPELDIGSGRMWLAGEAKDLGLIDEVVVLDVAMDAWYGADAKVHPYAPRRTLMDEFGAEAVAAVVADRVLAAMGGGDGELE